MPVHHHLPHIYKNIKFGTKVEEIQKNNPKRVMISLKCYRKRLLSPIPNTHTHTHTHTHEGKQWKGPREYRARKEK